ncbi:hypothetical protein [Tunicatimonas pelagia]|uniref:hypothetical protein n=1 Tax=Tunicatimonas pelagia TaxID=931531 RepID=UPI00266627CD|nr:hypothetical protein [Tunicatimonas pelagia]WKN45646.1 hypothetical protein P0M28_11825 [Tunicatimonas pelagia]
MYEVWMNEGGSSMRAILALNASPLLKSRPIADSRYQTVIEGKNQGSSTVMSGTTT